MRPTAADLRCFTEALNRAGAKPGSVAQDVRQLFEQVLVAPAAEVGLENLQTDGIIARWLPEIQATVDLGQELGRHHKDVWQHTLQVVAQAEPTAIVRWGALLHDIGKPGTRKVTGTDVTFRGHEELGARLFDRIAHRMSFPSQSRRSIRQLIVHHFRPAQYEATWSDAAVRRLARDLGPDLDALLALCQADVTSKQQAKIDRARRRIDALRARIRSLEAAEAATVRLPTGLGRAIMERFGITEGPRIGELLRLLVGAIERGELKRDLAIDRYLEHLANDLR